MYATETAALSDLRAHPQNYRAHPEEQQRHVTASIREHGFYRNVVVAQDGTILAGHGVVEAAREAGLTEIPVVRLPLSPDDPRALKVLTGDNEVMRLAAVDDRALAELLREIRDDDLENLLGTGFDDAMLTNLIFVTRPRSEIGGREDAAAWVGLPAFDEPGAPVRLVVSFDSPEDRLRFMEEIGVEKTHKKNEALGVWSCWWPNRPREDLASLRFTGEEVPA